MERTAIKAVSEAAATHVRPEPARLLEDGEERRGRDAKTVVVYGMGILVFTMMIALLAYGMWRSDQEIIQELLSILKFTLGFLMAWAGGKGLLEVLRKLRLQGGD